MKIIKINPDNIVLWKEEAGKLFFKKEAEEQLLKLLELKKQIDEAIEEVKEKIKEAGEKTLGIEFKGVIGENIKVINRYYGAKYEIEDEELARPFIKEVKKFVLDTKKVEEFEKENGDLPDGIRYTKREQKLSIILNE